MAKSGKEQACIRAEGLDKGFASQNGPVRVLDGLSFTVMPGESVAVVGASGLGKSTLLHMLGTLEKPDKGRLVLGGRDILSMGDVELARFRNRFLGFVFQFHHLLPEFTALENAAMPALIARVSKSKAQEKAREILARVGLEKRLHHRTGQLSGGERQRVALARALVMDPKVLLADEPTGNLDVKTGDRIHGLLAELNAEKGTAMVVVTHNLELARRMDRRVTLREGRIEGVD
jgi:lipoprotein-releasing system ATP-binding protein